MGLDACAGAQLELALGEAFQLCDTSALLALPLYVRALS